MMFNLSFKHILFSLKGLLQGYPISRFVHRVVSDPIKSRSDPELKYIYEFYKRNRNFLILNRSQRNILYIILSKPFSETINELPHLFVNSLEKQTYIHSIPSFSFLHPKDCKSGDAFCVKESISFEFKTVTYLAPYTLTLHSSQFSQNQTNNTLTMSLIYDHTDPVSGSFSVMEYIHGLKNISFCESNIKIRQVEDLKSLAFDQANLERFFSYYNVSWNLYVAHQFDVLIQKTRQVISLSSNAQATILCQKFLIEIESEKSYFIQAKQILPNSRLITHFEKTPSHLLDDFPLDSDSSVKEPEDIISDVGSWFGDGDF